LNGIQLLTAKRLREFATWNPVVVIERDRPEGTGRWRAAFVEVDRVLVRSVERFAGFVDQIEGVDRILGKIRAKADLCDDGALQVPVSIDAHGVGVH
jgi:hypothetical protein